MRDLPGISYSLLHFPEILWSDHGQEVFPLSPLLIQSESSAHKLHSVCEVMGVREAEDGTCFSMALQGRELNIIILNYALLGSPILLYPWFSDK